VVIGGKGRRKEKQADKIALLAMEASLQLRDILPQLSLRFYKGQDPRLMQKALEVIGQGGTFPILYNDDVNIPAAARAFNIGEKEAQQVVPFGCGEYIIYHKSVGTPSSVLNLLKALEVTLHKG
jgi:pyruvate-formate lyase